MHVPRFPILEALTFHYYSLTLCLGRGMGVLKLGCFESQYSKKISMSFSLNEV